MKRANDTNLNTRSYWNEVYGTAEKREGYAQTGTDHSHGAPGQKTARFSTTLKYLKGAKTFLDMGCGVGEMTKLAKDTYPDLEVWGTDISDKAIADNANERSDIYYYAKRVGELDSAPGYFDVIFCGETIEHLDDPSLLFKEAHHALAPGGLLIITTPNNDAIRSPEHTWYFTHDDIIELYEKNGYSSPEFEYLKDLEHILVIYAVGRKK